jgi:glycosyltransferase involved in cell wall biosynthesis
MRIVVASVQVPFIAGGAELLANGLVAACIKSGHPTELVTLPFRFFPPAEVARAMEVWEGEDFGHLNLYEPDRVICLKFPAYGLRHPRKVHWILHQHRAAYDLLRDDADDEEEALGKRIKAFDALHLQASQVFTISARVAQRLKSFNSIDATPLYHPPPEAEKLYRGEALPFVFYPSRFEDAKRQELLVRALAKVKSPVGVVLAGEGGQSERIARLVDTLGLRDRVRLVGKLSWDELRAFYARSLAVFFGPLDEDYGYVTLEAMLSAKPVITCTDSGGPLEFVADGITGAIVPPEPAAVAQAIDGLWADRARARRMGEAGLERYRSLEITWDRVVERLVGTT